MSDQEDKTMGAYTLDEPYVREMIKKTEFQLEIIADLLSIATREDILHAKVLSTLCDAYSSNYHLRRTLQVNLSCNLIEDEKTKQKIIILPDKDLTMLEQAIIARAYTAVELAKLNYSLKIH
jgi:hypothetical protein